ncbi:hypothetical protein ACJX0J_041158, partial [Zea mays]
MSRDNDIFHYIYNPRRIKSQNPRIINNFLIQDAEIWDPHFLRDVGSCSWVQSVNNVRGHYMTHVISGLNCQKAKEILYSWTGYMVKIFFFIEQKRTREKEENIYDKRNIQINAIVLEGFVKISTWIGRDNTEIV